MLLFRNQLKMFLRFTVNNHPAIEPILPLDFEGNEGPNHLI